MGETPTGLRSTRWPWITAIWCAGALIDASQTVLVMRVEGVKHPWLPLFATELAAWLPWMIATPLISGLARRYAVFPSANLPAFAVHCAALALVSSVASAWFALLTTLFNPWDRPEPPGPFMEMWRSSFLYQFLTYSIVYALILAITNVMDSNARITRQQTETARLNEELSRAQLAALRRQMEPHFIFNTLNSIAGLVRSRRYDAAVSMTVGLSEFLRRAAADTQPAQVTLAEEAEYLQRYVDIQKARFAERLKVSMDIPAELLQTPVPSLLLQPLVENAIKHGISKRIAGGEIRVTAARRNGRLTLSVLNDGPHLPPDWQSVRNGIGITNLRTRLRILNDSDFDLQLRNVDGGVEVLVSLPLREV